MSVHNRAPGLFLKDVGWRSFLGFQILVGGMILSSLLHTVFIGALLGRLVREGVVGLVPQDVWDWFAVGILATGYGGAFAIVISGLFHQRAWHLLPIQTLLPAYWVLHSIAALFAARELITKPIHWAKTTHGVTKVTRGHQVESEAKALLRPAYRLSPRSGHIDLGRRARDDVGEDAARAGGHGPAQRAVPRAQVEIVESGPGRSPACRPASSA